MMSLSMPMLDEPLFIILILLAVVIFAVRWSDRFQDSPVMRYIPTPVLCYLPPTVLTTMGILPQSSHVYDWIARYVLPACLILLLMTTDIKGLRKVGRSALLAMFVATISVVIGGVVVFLIYRGHIGPEAWKAVGTMTASLTGGTVNAVAVKQATNLSDSLFVPLFISDITVVYIWMTLLMVLSARQKGLDKILHANRAEMDIALAHTGPSKPRTKRIPMRSLLFLLLIGFGLGTITLWIGEQLPEIGMGLTRGTWVIILVTTLGLILSQTQFPRTEGGNAMKVGYFLLYLVLAGTGAKANLLAILKFPIFLAMGCVWVAIHACILIAMGRLLGIPSAMLATASQANLGGVASAPVVASTYEPKLVPVALILAILGDALGNYIGILTGQLLLQFGG